MLKLIYERYNIPEEIVQKIRMYKHPILNNKIQDDIKCFVFFRKNRIEISSKYCRLCNRFHRIPKHFKCY